MDDKPLIGETGSKKSYSKECMIPSFIAGVLGVLLIGSLIGIIVMATLPSDNSCDKPSFSSSTSPVTPALFTEFYAESFLRICDSLHFHCASGSKQKMYAFGPGKYGIEQYDENDTIISRQFSLAQDKTVVMCQNIVTHNNCVNITYDQNTLAFTTIGTTLEAKEQPCYSLFPDLQTLIPDRKLDKCDYYTMSSIDSLTATMDSDVVLQIITESGTNYPVVQVVKTFQDASSMMRVYSSFTPKRPEDESVLKPFDGVPVFDFRNGENCSEEITFSTKKDAPENEHIKAMKRNAAIRSYLNAPIELGFSASSSVVRNTPIRSDDEIPKEFDARTNFSDCTSVIGAIVDQGVCQSCWAMSSAAVLADRFCVANQSKGTLSPQYMVYCGKHSFGCSGQMLTPDIWSQLINEGTVSEQCIPFAGRNGKCPTLCYDNSNITDDKIYRAKSVVVPWDSAADARVKAIQTEIMQRGPVQAIFLTYTDIVQFVGGVYQRTKDGVFFSSHAVRIIGWGTTDDGIDYWLIANSWGVLWGEGGVFKMRRGTNECNIEEAVIAGIVDEQH